MNLSSTAVWVLIISGWAAVKHRSIPNAIQSSQMLRRLELQYCSNLLVLTITWWWTAMVVAATCKKSCASFPFVNRGQLYQHQHQIMNLHSLQGLWRIVACLVEALYSSNFWPAQQKLLLVEMHTKESSSAARNFCLECNPPSCSTASLE